MFLSDALSSSRRSLSSFWPSITAWERANVVLSCSFCCWKRKGNRTSFGNRVIGSFGTRGGGGERFPMGMVSVLKVEISTLLKSSLGRRDEDVFGFIS